MNATRLLMLETTALRAGNAGYDAFNPQEMSDSRDRTLKGKEVLPEKQTAWGHLDAGTWGKASRELQQAGSQQGRGGCRTAQTTREPLHRGWVRVSPELLLGLPLQTLGCFWGGCPRHKAQPPCAEHAGGYQHLHHSTRHTQLSITYP